MLPLIHPKEENKTPHFYRYILAFGSNLGNRKKNLHLGLKELKKYLNIVKISPWIKTDPLCSNMYDTKDHNFYINFLCDTICHMHPEQLYLKIKNIEDHIGHSRDRKWLPRKLDIDIIFWAENNHSDFKQCCQKKYSTHSLTVPHYDFKNRDFLINLYQRHIS